MLLLLLQHFRDNEKKAGKFSDLSVSILSNCQKSVKVETSALTVFWQFDLYSQAGQRDFSGN